ncbi:unnamed protein product [Aphis gossypii]|uniref:C2H2-type domain-containing protein n=1 Tax=Aphis gossypii TaxID=80765 RepID=A0A9P0J6V7_APHGO|nr:unnamed protein product [Aphis gossypii]
MFKCVTCNKEYAHKRNLVRHAKIHDGTTNTCGICLKTYSRKDKLGDHLHTCHSIPKNSSGYEKVVGTITGETARDSVIHWALPATPPSHADPVAQSPAAISTDGRTDTSTPLEASSTSASPPLRPTTQQFAQKARQQSQTLPPPPSSIDRARRPSSSHAQQCVNHVTNREVDWRTLVCSVQENSVPKHPEYSTLLSRLKTFDSHPLRSCRDKYSLAECGFTYTGTGDSVRCFYCGLLLLEWEEDDEAWQQHAMHNPKCVYVLLCKGVKFIEYAKNALQSCQWRTEK